MIFRRDREYAVDSFPVAICQKSRIDRRKLFRGKQYLGFSASKKQYFCGIRVHMIVTLEGAPVEMTLRPGSESDLKTLWSMDLELPIGSILYADGAYTCFELEDILKHEEGITLMPKRGKSIRNRVWTKAVSKQISSKRQIVETAFSRITALLPRALVVRTEEGFWVRIFSAVLAYTLRILAQVA
jgi:IS5 family transposase